MPRACPGDICAVAKVDELHFDAVLHDAAEDDHIHLKPLDFPVPVHGLAIEPEAPWRRAAHVGDPDQAGRRRPVPEGRARGRHQRDRASTAWASCTCACCWSGCARSTSSRSTRARRASPTARPSPRRPKATTATRSRAAAPASSARSSCASSRCRAARGFEFVDAVKGGTIPGQFMPAVEKGVREVLAQRRDRRLPGGGRAGDRLRRQAPQRGQQGDRLRHRRPQGLHRRPSARRGRSCWSRSCTSRSPRPTHAMGDITGDLSAKRGQVNGTHNGAAGTMVVRGQVPHVRAVGLPVAAERA